MVWAWIGPTGRVNRLFDEDHEEWIERNYSIRVVDALGEGWIRIADNSRGRESYIQGRPEKIESAKWDILDLVDYPENIHIEFTDAAGKNISDMFLNQERFIDEESFSSLARSSRLVGQPARLFRRARPVHVRVRSYRRRA